MGHSGLIELRQHVGKKLDGTEIKLPWDVIILKENNLTRCIGYISQKDPKPSGQLIVHGISDSIKAEIKRLKTGSYFGDMEFQEPPPIEEVEINELGD